MTRAVRRSAGPVSLVDHDVVECSLDRRAASMWCLRQESGSWQRGIGFPYFLPLIRRSACRSRWPHRALVGTPGMVRSRICSRCTTNRSRPGCRAYVKRRQDGLARTVAEMMMARRAPRLLTFSICSKASRCMSFGSINRVCGLVSRPSCGHGAGTTARRYIASGILIDPLLRQRRRLDQLVRNEPENCSARSLAGVAATLRFHSWFLTRAFSVRLELPTIAVTVSGPSKM